MDMFGRRRFNSSMTYNEYVDIFDQAPPKPIFRPLEQNLNEIPELNLNNSPVKRIRENDSLTQSVKLDYVKINTKIETLYRPKLVIQELDEMKSNDELLSQCDKIHSFRKDSINKKIDHKLNNQDYRNDYGRARSQSEKINFTFMSFLEKSIQIKQSRDFPMNNFMQSRA